MNVVEYGVGNVDSIMSGISDQGSMSRLCDEILASTGLVVIAGSCGSGKTLIGDRLVNQLVTEYGSTIVSFSPEQYRVQLIDGKSYRCMCRLSDILEIGGKFVPDIVVIDRVDCCVDVVNPMVLQDAVVELAKKLFELGVGTVVCTIAIHRHSRLEYREQIPLKLVWNANVVIGVSREDNDITIDVLKTRNNAPFSFTGKVNYPDMVFVGDVIS